MENLESYRPVQAAAELLVWPVGGRRRGGLGRSQVLEPRTGDGLPANTDKPKHQTPTASPSFRGTQLSPRGEPAFYCVPPLIIHGARPRFSWGSVVEAKREQLGGGLPAALGDGDRDISAPSQDDSARPVFLPLPFSFIYISLILGQTRTNKFCFSRNTSAFYLDRSQRLKRVGVFFGFFLPPSKRC